VRVKLQNKYIFDVFCLHVFVIECYNYEQNREMWTEFCHKTNDSSLYFRRRENMIQNIFVNIQYTMYIDNNHMSMHIDGEIDQDKILPMEEIEMRTMTKKRIASRKPRKTATKTVKRKRCKKGSRINPKTKRCNKKCLPNQKRNPKTMRCVLRKN